MKKKVVSLMLVLAMTVSMTACGNKNNAADDANAVEDTEAGTESGSSEEAVAPANYEEVSAELYDKELGDFGQLTRKLMKLKPFLRNLHLKQSQKQS